MANAKKNTKKINRRKKVRLKKSARWTIAGLLMATAIIIALIPVQNGGVSATTTTPNTVPSVADLCDDSKHGEVSASVSAGTDDAKKAFPYRESFSIGSVRYNVIDMSGMPYNETVPVPIFDITKGDQGDYKYIKKYIGGGGSPYMPTAGINLQNSVCINLNDSANANFSPSSDDPLILEKKDGDADVINHSKAGTYTYYTEQLMNGSENGQSYKYFKVTKIVKEVRGTTVDGAFVPDPVEYDASEQEVYYCVKDSAPSNNDAIKNIAFIADGAFEGEGSITSITIPDAITKIGERAFKDCANINTVNIGSKCESIGDEAFAGCSSLTNLNIEDGSLNKIGDCAFYGCSGLSTVQFPHTASITVGSGAFAECSSLRTFDFSKAGSPVALGCNVFSNDTALGTGDVKGVSLIGQDSTTGVNDIKSHSSSDGCGIFNNCNNLQYAQFPNNYTGDVPKGTFAGCKSLGYVEFLNGNASVEDPKEFSDDLLYGRFYIWGPDDECDIKNYAASVGATYRSSVPPDTNIDNYELRRKGYKYDFTRGEDGNATITKISIYDASIADETLEIPATIGGFNIKEIAESACTGLSKPKHVIIPDSVDTIGNSAFYNMPALEDVTFKHNRDIQTGEDIPTSQNMTIGANCFANNQNLTRVSIRTYDDYNGSIHDPNITELGENAFFTASSKSLTIHGKMDPSYKPYAYAIDPNNRVNQTLGGYITYETQAPELLVCKYDPTVNDDEGGVSLISYPTKDTHTKINGTDYTVQGLIDAYNSDPMSATDIMRETKRCFENIFVPEGITSIENANTGNMFKNIDGTKSVTLTSVQTIPNEAFSSTKGSPSTLESVSFLNDIIDSGVAPFKNSSNITAVSYYGDYTFEGYNNATKENPYYWFEDGIIYSYDGEDTVLEECLPSKGSNNDKVVRPRTDITKINDNAFYNCDMITDVLMGECNDLEVIPKYCFADCDNLKKVVLPESCDQVMEGAFAGCRDFMEVEMPSIEYDIDDKAFWTPVGPDGTKLETKEPKIWSYSDSAAIKYAKRMGYDYDFLDENIVATFYNVDGSIVEAIRLTAPGTPKKPATDPVHPSKNPKYKFIGWSPDITEISVSTAYVAQYEDTSASSSSSSSTSSSTSGGGSSSNPGGSSSSRSTSSSSSRSTSSSSNSSSATPTGPVIVSGAPAPYTGANAGAPATNGVPGTASAPNNNVQTGNANVISTAPGISNNGKMSATVNGTSDNYIIKITQTDEADALAKQALTGAFGSLDNIRYMPFDIALYDSTGTNKISPVPEGVTVSVTMPIPDDLTIYGGNNKIASTGSGVLGAIQPRFTVIDGVPCMNFTVSSLSPHVIYVDTANLQASGISDATPKTGDPIHPKWFLVIGLAAISIFLFLKRDKEAVPFKAA